MKLQTGSQDPVEAILKYNSEVTAEMLADFDSACEVAKDLKIEVEKHWGLGW